MLIVALLTVVCYVGRASTFTSLLEINYNYTFLQSGTSRPIEYFANYNIKKLVQVVCVVNSQNEVCSSDHDNTQLSIETVYILFTIGHCWLHRYSLLHRRGD